MVRPLSGASPAHIPLPSAPLIGVIAQLRFGTILKIRDPLAVANFQEKIRKLYPYLSDERGPQIVVTSGSIPSIQEMLIWRFSDHADNHQWRVSLAPNFVALETKHYESQADLLRRLRVIIESLNESFQPSTVQRFGLRYIDRLSGEAMGRLGSLIRPHALGIECGNGSNRLSEAVVHMLTQAEIRADEGTIQARWGRIPADGSYDPANILPQKEDTWVLDLDMFTALAEDFNSEKILLKAQAFSDRIYDVFREMVQEDFLRFFGGKI